MHVTHLSPLRSNAAFYAPIQEDWPSERALALDIEAARLHFVDLDADLVLFIFGGRSVESHPQTLLGASAVLIRLLDHSSEHVVRRRQQRPFQRLRSA